MNEPVPMSTTKTSSVLLRWYQFSIRGLSVNHGQSVADAAPAWCCCMPKSVMEKIRPVADSQNCVADRIAMHKKKKRIHGI